jgi:hypothetical protein
MKHRMGRWARPSLGRLSGSILLLALSAGACASSPQRPAETARKPEPAAARRLAWMPLDGLDAPAIAQAVNERMSAVRPTGTSTSVKAAVSMEVAQLAIECIQPTPACYGAVGRSLGADRLMWAELEPSSDDEKIRLSVVVFDVHAGTAPRRVAETFAGTAAAREGAAGLVDRATGPERRAP